MDPPYGLCFLQDDGWVHKKYTYRERDRQSHVTFYKLLALEVM